MGAETTQLELALHDRVVTNDGREGTVVGFYRLEDDSVLVSFAAYDTARYPASHVGLLSAEPI